MRVIIAGGGIGGLCLAQGLTKAGIEVAVYERDLSRSERLDRYRLHISPAGSRALHACLPASAWKAFLAGTGEAEGGFGFLTERLQTLVVVDDDVMYPQTADPAEQAHPADRMFLREVLLSGLDGVVRFGQKLDSYALLPGGAVTARFADGATATGDVLVGADGAGSAVRRQYLPAAVPVLTGALGIGRRSLLTAPPGSGSRGGADRHEHDHGRRPFFLFPLASPPGAGGRSGPRAAGGLPALRARRAP